MIKRIILSVIMITVAVSAVAAATSAYFSNGQVLGNNTFSTGTVKIDGFNKSINVTGLIPGTPVWAYDVGVNYTGSINADLYVGAGGTSAPGDPNYLADKVFLRIYKQGTSIEVWEGYVNVLSTNWINLANDIAAGWQAYDLQFTLDFSAPNSYQGANNTDTQILMYAVQHGGPVPGTFPYQTTFSN
jgi:hypothetical protein